MSSANHPNLHAAGLTVDLITAILARRRGAASTMSDGEVLALVQPDIVDFVARVDSLLDFAAERKREQQKKTPGTD